MADLPTNPPEVCYEYTSIPVQNLHGSRFTPWKIIDPLVGALVGNGEAASPPPARGSMFHCLQYPLKNPTPASAFGLDLRPPQLCPGNDPLENFSVVVGLLMAVMSYTSNIFAGIMLTN